MTHRYESSATVAAPADRVFTHVDDHARLSSHMSGSSWMMGGGRMTIDVDEGRGQRVGSRIRLAGKAFGMELSVEEAITQRDPPYRKAWETIGEPKLLVVGHYRMGFELLPRGQHSELRVFIEYELPSSPVARLLGRLFAASYAKWCTRRMVADTVRHFARAARDAHT